MKIENVKIGDIKPYEKNAKAHPKKQIQQIADSIKAFGWAQPIVLDKKSVIIVGHGRYEAAKLLELKDVPTITVNLSEEKAKAYRLADNKLNESKWDMDLVIEELKLMSEEMIDMTGFDKDLILEGNEHDDDVPAVTGAVKTRIGDVWALGDHLLACGDSTDPKSVAALLDGEKAAMCWTDPPYNMNYEGGGSAQKKKRDKILNDKMSAGNFREFLENVCVNILAHTEGGIYICMGENEMPNLRSAFTALGGRWAQDIIWVKNNFSLSGDHYQHTFEPILYGFNKDTKNPYFVDRRDISNVWEDLSEIKTEFDGKKTTITFHGFKIRIDGEVKGGEVVKKKQHMDIWRHNKPERSAEHPTMKPVSLVMEAIMNSSQDGDIVLDLFMGSGSTIIAAEKSGRICYGMELDPHYVDVCIKRWSDYTGKKAKKI